MRGASLSPSTAPCDGPALSQPGRHRTRDPELDVRGHCRRGALRTRQRHGCASRQRVAGPGPVQWLAEPVRRDRPSAEARAQDGQPAGSYRWSRTARPPARAASWTGRCLPSGAPSRRSSAGTCCRAGPRDVHVLRLCAPGGPPRGDAHPAARLAVARGEAAVRPDLLLRVLVLIERARKVHRHVYSDIRLGQGQWGRFFRHRHVRELHAAPAHQQ